MKLLGNRIHIKRVQPPTSIGGIYLPPIALDDINTGGPKIYEVLAVGPGRMTKKGVRIPIEVSVGDRILCHSYTDGPSDLEDGTKLITDDQVLLVMPKVPVCETENPPA